MTDKSASIDITITLSDEAFRKLCALALDRNLTPEALASRWAEANIEAMGENQ